MTWDGDVIRLYVDGNLENSQTVGPKMVAYSAFPLSLGRHSLNSARGFDGLIDEPALYDRALSAADIRAIYVAGIAGKCPCPPGQHFDVAADFSITSNPSGAWTYGWQTSLATPFQRSLLASQNDDGHPGLDSWLGGARSAFPRTFYQAGSFWLHPGLDGEVAVTRWTAPADGRAVVNGVFSALTTTTTDVHVRHNGGEIFTGAINGIGSQAPFARTVSVQAGDTVDFAIGWGNNDALSDSTGLGVTVDFQPACARGTCIPLPADAVAWWPGEGTGGDLIGGRALMPGDGAAYAAGKVGTAFSFTDQAPGFSLGQSLADVRDNFTIEFWVLPAADRASTSETVNGISGTARQRYVLYPERAPFGAGGVGVSVGRNGISIFEHSPDYLPSLLVYDTAISDWTHVAVVYQAKQPRLYINGVLVRTGLTSQRSYVYPGNSLGDRSSYGPYRGLLDEFTIYKRVLGDAEIAAIFGASSAGKCRPTEYPDLVVADLQVPAVTVAGQPVEVRWTVKNLGTAATPANWTETLSLSEDATGCMTKK